MNWTEEEYNAYCNRYKQQHTKKSKYGNIKTEVDGIKFDSKRESERYKELKLMEQSGDIKELQMQKKWLLQKGFEKGGKKYRPIYYISDFSYYNIYGKYIVEDVKGKCTKEYQIKKKLFEYKYPNLSLMEVS